jgi:hypothetical protein
MAVHVSPLQLMLTRPVDAKDDPYRARSVLSLDTVTWLSEIYLYYTDTHVRVALGQAEPGKADTESDRIAAIDREWYAQVFANPVGVCKGVRRTNAL